MNKFLRMMVARGYWEQAGEPGSGTDTGGSESSWSPPADFTKRDTEVVERGLAELDDVFGAEDESAGESDPVQKPGEPPVDKTPAVEGEETPKEETSPAPVDERTEEQRKADEDGAFQPTGDVNQMPKSWKAGLAADYAALPESVKAEIHRREENFFKGLEARQPAVNFAIEMDETIRPFADVIKAQGATPKSAVNYLFSAYTVMTRGTPDQRVQALTHFMKESGVTLEQLQGAVPDPALEAFEDPAVKALRDELNGVKSQLTEQQQQVQRDLKAKAEREFDAFAKDHPDIDKVVDDMVPLLRAGMSLQQAYDKAIWANPVTRELKLKADADAKAETERKAAEEKAKKARAATKTNVRASSTRGGPTAPLGSIDDTMQEVLSQIKARG